MKGPEDPIISFRSRKSRLTGEWNLTSGNTDGTLSNGQGSVTFSSTFDGATETDIFDNQYFTHPYTEKLEFSKDNIFKSTVLDNTETTIRNGFWAFMDGYNYFHNKECVVIRLSSQIIGDSIKTYTGDNMPNYILRFDKLSNSEAIIGSYGQTIGTTTNSNSSTKTYTKK